MSAQTTSASAAQPTTDVATLRAWAALVDSLPDAAWVVELPTLAVVAANELAAAWLGHDHAALLGARADQLLATPEDLAYWEGSAAADGASPPDALDSDSVLVAADGRTLQVRRAIRAIAGPAGAAARHALVTLRDRSPQHQTEARFEDTLAELQATLEATADGILVIDLAGRIRGFNRRFAELWQLPSELIEDRGDQAVLDWMRRSVNDQRAYQRQLEVLDEATLLSATERLQLLSGKVLERVSRPLWSRGRPLGRVFSFRDLTARLEADERIESLVRTDNLTGLPNRRHLAERLADVALGMRHDGDGFALLLVDLDRFRRVNDSLGHKAGDQVLVDTAERIRSGLRQGDLLARVAGDQFALLLQHTDAAAAEGAAQRVIDAVAEPWQSGDLPFTLTCSVGIALSPAHGRSADELLRHAESAVQLAKHAGSNGLRFHQQHAGFDLRQAIQLDHAMRQALASNRFRLHFQPQVALDSGKVIGAEALLRWRDPSLGEISPGRFIPVAEETGFITAIGDWVLAHAARQAAQWHREGNGLPVAVNVSALQFRQAHFVDRVAAALRDNQLPPELLELELTESVLVHDADEALLRLQALSRLGVRLSIDDFGTGYSSLSYLKRFPINKLKIDRSFVQGLPDDEHDVGIVRAIVQMASALAMQVVAEGVETEPQRQFLRQAGCHQFQGYLFAPAMDPLSFAKRIGSPAPKAKLALVRPQRER